MVSIQNLPSDKSFSNFSFSLYYLIVAAYRGVFRTWSNIIMELSGENTVLSCKLFLPKKTQSQMFDWVEYRLLA